MDAALYLKRQGWQGDGHALSHTGNGLKKPLLISKKVDVLGVGINKHAAVSDQWWMRAFDQGLKDLGTGKKGILSTVREKGVHLGGLYGRFVKGETVEGTIEEQEMAGKKRKRSDAKEQREREPKRRASEGIPKVRLTASKEIDRKAKTFITEAVKRGLIPEEGSTSSRGPGASLYHDEAVIKSVFSEAGLDVPLEYHNSAKNGKYERGKAQRAVKRAARAYIMKSMSPAERAQLDQESSAKSEEKERLKREKRAIQEAQEAHQIAHKAEKAARRAEKKLAREEERRNASPPVPVKKELTASFENNADEVKLSMPKGKVKKIPGIGIVDRYPTKAEKKATKLLAQAEAKAREEAKALAAQPPEPPEPVEKPAAVKKSKKKAAVKIKKESSSEAESDSDSSSESESEDEQGGVKVEPESASDDGGENLGFVVDTAGDDTLEQKPASVPGSRAINVVDNEGNIRYTVQEGVPVPLDPAIWEGIKPKLLPRIVRSARREWMVQKREAKKAAKAAKLGAEGGERKTRGQKKAETREKFVVSILVQSRKAMLAGQDVKPTTVDGVENVPLIRMETQKGPFSKAEMKLARTSARRVMRHEKRKERDAKGKGKGYKKRQREEVARLKAGLGG